MKARWGVRFGLCALISVGAQAGAQSCQVSETARWYKRQHAWLREAGRTWSNDSLRRSIIGALGADTSGLDQPQLGMELITNDGVAAHGADSSVIALLTTIARQRGAPWPTKSVVGPRGVRAIWTLALRDTALQRVVLHRMMEAGPEESFPPDVAVMEDRLRVRGGRGQLYGTQLRAITAKAGVEPLPTEDLAHVDLRREGAFLPPLALSSCIAAKAQALAR